MVKKDVLTETTEQAMEKVTAGVNEQVALAEKFFALYQKQVEKTTKLWTYTATTAMAEGQKAAKAWMDLGTEITADARKTFEANIKDATKVFTPAA